MTERKIRTEAIEAKAVLARDEAFIRSVVKTALQKVLEAEMTRPSARPRGNGPRAVLAIGRAITGGR